MRTIAAGKFKATCLAVMDEVQARRETSRNERCCYRISYPKDPTDRVIGATLPVHGLELITRDVSIRASGEVMCVW